MPVNPYAGFFNQFSNTGANAYGSALGFAGTALGAQTAGQGQYYDRLSNLERNLIDQQANLLNRQSAWERNYVDHDLGLKGNETNRYGIDTGRSNLLDQIRSSDRQFDLGNFTNQFGIQANYDSNLFNSLSNLAGDRYGADRAAQASLGSAAIGAQANMVAPMLQQQRFMSLAPHVLGAIGSIGKGSSNLSNALTGAK